MENGTSSRRYLIPLLLVSLFGIFLLSGCLEHRYLYKFDLEGACDFTYKVKGDSSDMFDEPKALPDSFTHKTWTEQDTSGATKYVYEATARFQPDGFPRTLSLKEVPWTEVFLHHPTNLSRITFFLCTWYKFEANFKSRNRTAEEGDRWRYIPEECRPLEDPQDSTLSDTLRAELEQKYAAGMIIWNAERYKLRFREIVKQSLTMHPDVKVPPAWVDSALTEIDSLVNAYTANLQIVDLNTVNLEWWKELAPLANRILTENLNLLGGDSTLQAELQHVGEILELRHLVSEDLADESYEVRVDLPGRILKSNTEVMDKGVLVWKFSGGDLTDSDWLVQASSLYIFSDRIAGTIVALLILFIVLKYRKSKQKRNHTLPPPPIR